MQSDSVYLLISNGYSIDVRYSRLPLAQARNILLTVVIHISVWTRCLPTHGNNIHTTFLYYQNEQIINHITKSRQAVF